MTTSNSVAKIWSFCNALRDDGVSYSDYLEQLTFLLFLKMADEQEKGPQKRKSGIPARSQSAEHIATETFIGI